jgi:hypothetical protein
MVVIILSGILMGGPLVFLFMRGNLWGLDYWQSLFAILSDHETILNSCFINRRRRPTFPWSGQAAMEFASIAAASCLPLSGSVSWSGPLRACLR